MKSIIQIYIAGVWHEAALIESGGRDRCTFEYLPEYVFGDICQPVSLTLPVSMAIRQSMGVCPAFLLDMVPQGNGRRYLTQQLNLADSDDLIMPKSGTVVRLHQESLASLAGHHSFGIRPNHFDLVNAFLPVVTNPLSEIIEYIKRDLLNLALRNTDNHARNTAVQQLEDGTVQLTPVFDIAPMFMDREIIVRASRWLNPAGQVINNFADVIEGLPLKNPEKNTVMAAIKTFAKEIANLPLTMAACGVDHSLIELCKPHINDVYESIAKGCYLNKVGGAQ